MSTTRRTLRVASAVVALGAAAVAGGLAPACSNPVIDQEIEALGGETPGVEPGPNHRPGQPCVLCHSKYFGVQPEFAVGGTVFADLESFKPAESVDVILTDSIGQTFRATTNCVGNFYIPATSNPQFPLAVEIRYPVYNADGTLPENPVQKVKAMGSVISRNGSCASCHTLYGRAPAVDAAGNILNYPSTGWIYCNAAGETDPFPEAKPGCIPPSTSMSTSAAAGATSSASGGG